MSGIKYYALSGNEEQPDEFVVVRHVDGEPEFIASYVNTDYLSYENGVLLKMHERNDELRAENARLREVIADGEMHAQEIMAENARLRGFWTYDGTWHVELPRLPDAISVMLPDERDREVHSARTWTYIQDGGDSDER